MRHRATSTLAGAVCSALWVATAWAGATAHQTDRTPLLTTGVTGSIRASGGLEDPQYVLSFAPVQRLMLLAAHRPLSRGEIDTALATTPVSRADLLRLELVREDRNLYRLNYLLLTVKDQQTMFDVGARYGQSLADAFRAHRGDFDRILSAYPDSTLRRTLAFDLIAGAALNWEGLALTTELGYRVQPRRHENGDVYLVHSAESGARQDLAGLYLDSETAPGPSMSFTTFGDGPSMPRLDGLPDVFEGVESALENWRKRPDVYAALRAEYLTYVVLAMDDAGRVIQAVSGGADSDSVLARTVPISEDRMNATLGLLTSIGYLRVENHRYVPGVPVLTERDKPMVDETLQLSRAIMKEWLGRNYALMEASLAGLSPMRNGVPYALAFSEVWHYTFGSATKSLAESGFFANPRAPGSRYAGYSPLVWANAVLRAPGD